MTTTFALKDSNLVTWYWWINPTSGGKPEIAYASEAPSGVKGAGEWFFDSSTYTTSTAECGITYLTFIDSASKTWYAYPGTDGTPIITDSIPDESAVLLDSGDSLLLQDGGELLMEG